MVQRIGVRDLQVFTCIGVTAAERSRPQPIFVSFTAVRDVKEAVQNDSVADTFDYSAAAKLVKRCAASLSRTLLERLVADVAESLLEADPALSRIEVEALKPGIPTGSAGAYAFCSLEADE